MISDNELERLNRFHFAKDKHLFLVSRILLRTAISKFAPLKPQEWRFVTNKYGKPKIDPNLGFESISFNLSHTEGLVCCGFVFDRDIGVDIENLQREKISLEIANHNFASEEVEDLFSFPPHQQREIFFKYWTLKESFIKACGMGLSLPLDSFAFQFHEKGESPAVTFKSHRNTDPSRWYFKSFRPTNQHIAAVSVYGLPGESFKVTFIKSVPLVSESPMAEFVDG